MRVGAAADTVRAALVLSGGGSRGLAHAGAILGLERLGNDPYLVVGTSMGALVGALYAAGYTPEEIQGQVHEVNWQETFTPAPLILGPDRVIRYPLLVIDRDPDPLRFNRGFIPQWRINRILARLPYDANARPRADFDRLARRYRAVAADLRTGELVVLQRGDIARAARASMAFPGVLAPVEWDGRFLVDGGIADNLPVGVARDLGASRIIAVDVRTPTEEILGRAPLQVLNRAIDIMLRNVRRDTVPPDVMVVPPIPPSGSSLIFPEDPGPLFALGLEAALRDAFPVAPERPEPPTLPPAPVAFGGLRVEAPDPAFEALARSVFFEIAPGDYDPHRVLEAVDRLYTTGLFEAVWPRVEEGVGSAAPALVVRLEAPPKISLGGAIGYDTDRGGRAWAALQRSAVVVGAPTIVGVAGSLTDLEHWGELSARLIVPAWPVLGWSGGAYLKESDVRRFGPEPLSDQEVLRLGGWFGVEVQQALAARIATAALRAEWIGVVDGVDGFSIGPLVRIATPGAEPPIVGTRPEAEAEVRWGEISFSRFHGRASRSLPLGRLLSAAILDLAVTSGGAPPDDYPALGDDDAMPGYRWGEERNRVRSLVGVDLAYPIPLDGYLRMRLRAGAGVSEFRSVTEQDRWLSGAQLGLVWDTLFGTFAAEWGANTRGEQNLVVTLGSVF